MKVQNNLNISAMQPVPTKEKAQGGETQTDAQYFETVIIGTGFSGLLAAIRLQKKHCNDFVLLERSAELGGTWQVNSYPGAEVDSSTFRLALQRCWAFRSSAAGYQAPHPFARLYFL